MAPISLRVALPFSALRMKGRDQHTKLQEGLKVVGRRVRIESFSIAEPSRALWLVDALFTLRVIR